MVTNRIVLAILPTSCYDRAACLSVDVWCVRLSRLAPSVSSFFRVVCCSCALDLLCNAYKRFKGTAGGSKRSMTESRGNWGRVSLILVLTLLFFYCGYCKSEDKAMNCISKTKSKPALQYHRIIIKYYKRWSRERAIEGLKHD